MDASLAALPALASCDLSSNDIGIVQGLSSCYSLTELILSNNRIESVAQVGLCAGPLRRLVLQVHCSLLHEQRMHYRCVERQGRYEDPCRVALLIVWHSPPEFKGLLLILHG